MNEIICKIKIKIKDYYPKLKIIPYYNYECLISCQKEQLIIPLKNAETMFFENEPENINSDLIYNISLISKDNKYIISKSLLIIPYIRIIQIFEMKTLKFEQQIKLILENDAKEKIFGPGISVGSIFIKFLIEINSSKSKKSNIILINNNNNNKNNISKSSSKFKKTIDINQSSSIINISAAKKNLKLNEISQNKRILSTKYSTQKSYEQTNNFTSINKPNFNKNEYIYAQTSPFALKNYYNSNNQSAQLFNNEKNKKKFMDYNYYSPPPQSKYQKLYSKEKSYNINLKRYCSKQGYTNKINSKNNNNNITEPILSNCFSEISIKEKKIKKAPKSQKRFIKKIFSKEIDYNFNTIHMGENNILNEDKIIKNTSIEMNKKKSGKILSKSKKIPYKSSQKSVIKKNIEKRNSENINNNTESFNKKITKYNSLKSKTSKNFFIKDTKNRNPKNKIEKHNTLEPKVNLYEKEKKNININYINQVHTQEDIKNNILSIIDYFQKKNNDSKNSYNNAILRYLLFREKIVFENKKKYLLQREDNEKDIKDFIHVKINSKFNNIIFKKMSNIKIKEFNIIKIILNNRNKKDPKKIIQEKLKQQKQMLILLNVVRELIKKYGNLSHLYDDDNNKKILIKSLFLRYNIREKEWNENDNLLEMYNKIINEIKNQNKEKKKEIEEFKTIKEEEENENDEEEEKKQIIEERIEESNDEKENIEEEKIISNNEQSIKGNIVNENVNKDAISYNEKNIFDIKENLINNNNIKFDENVDINNIKTDLMNNKNIIINNIIINK